MKTINLSTQNTVMNRFMAEIRDKSYQKNRALFRNNILLNGDGDFLTFLSHYP